jgi:DNA-directed RNA polymerase subunit beta'
MIESPYDRINEYSSVSIKLASPQDIRSWSYGEVKKPETINYRTYRSEKDGLFCERIFGPERDYECFCGKYKGIKHRGITCPRCGVTVTHSRVRRKRMGHITLAAPIVHIWFFKSMPSRIGTLLAMKVTDLEKVVYYQSYVVTEAGDTPLHYKQVFNEDEYREAREMYGEKFKSEMGAEAVKKLLQQVDLEKLSEELRIQYDTTNSKQKKKDTVKRRKIVEDLMKSGNKPDWMVLEVIPVIPPDLRPLVLLESGNFATSDLNDLYRRLINRNNRLKKLMELNAPEVIIRNEKRMLQQSVDALFDNNRCRRPVLGSNSRPLRSLTDMIKGKQGRFRENLLGKRVDYSARSVIVVGPELRLHQCGLPKKIALELYQPFIIHRLKKLGYADTIRSAKKMLERKDEEVWDILEDVIRDHPVLLNRAPTLHRMGIQAFQPVLVEGNAIKIHPLVCAAFNADFDGDQIAVHLPLSLEAQVEAKTLMLSVNNVFSPAHGRPIIAPSQDMVLGCYYLTIMLKKQKGEGMRFFSPEEVLTALGEDKVGLHARVHVKMPGERPVKYPEGYIMDEQEQKEFKTRRIVTTPGRVVFNDILPNGMPFYNYILAKKELSEITADCHRLLGLPSTLKLLDDMKELGFKHATLGGLSFAQEDLKKPPNKAAIIKKVEEEVERIEKAYQKGIITEGERYNQIIDKWTHATEEVAKDMHAQLKGDMREGETYINPIFIMVESGARGSLQQIRQLAGMRGLMAKPSGKIIESPIRASFREGLSVCEYFSSAHGARKGLADTALKTADSGYLTRKLVDTAQNVIVTMEDCGTLNDITKCAVRRGDKIEVTLAESITGRVASRTIRNVVTDEVIVEAGEPITAEIAAKIEECVGKDSKIVVRSPLTCEAPLGICAKCYGMDLSKGRLAEEGLAVGIIAAESIGEPGTQLTMRTFHIGGIAFKTVEEGKLYARHSGTIVYRNVVTVTNKEGRTVVLNKNARMDIVDAKGRNRDEEGYSLRPGAVLKVKDKEEVTTKRVMAEWDPHMVPILAEKEGIVSFEDIVLDETVKEELDRVTGIKRKVIKEHKGKLHPQILIKDKEEKTLCAFPLPERAHIEVEEKQNVTLGTLLAKTPREIGVTQDITGGLPRVTELFEVRRPKSPAVMSEIDGRVEIGEKMRGKRLIKVIPEKEGVPKEYLIPPGRHLRVYTGDFVRAGEPLVEGPLVPQDILHISGEDKAQQYLLREVQSVYRSQSVKIDDKHVEIMIAQMMRRVQITDPGDSPFLPEEVVDKFKLKEENRRLEEEDKKPASAKPLLLGITKAALISDSFIAAASFQETAKVLTTAALRGAVDWLLGLKENVILGHMIPAGTGFNKYRLMRVKREIMPETKRQAEEPEAQEEKVLAT